MKGQTRIFALGVVTGLVLAACLAFGPPGKSQGTEGSNAVASNPLREYAESEEYLRDWTELRQAAEAWPLEKLEREYMILERAMREEVMWGEFLDACMVHAARVTSDAKLKRRWKPYHEACVTLSTISFATWLERTSLEKIKTEGQSPRDYPGLPDSYARHRLLYPHVRAQRLALTRALIDHVYYGDSPEMAEKEHPAWDLEWDWIGAAP